MKYTIVQWLLFFYIYCFLGWCFESTYVSIKERRPINRGFMRGPYLPLYGFGASLLLLVSIPVRHSIIFIFLVGMTSATILEYITGVCMESIFKVRYWDYSNQKFNFQGHICLSSSITWGVFAILLIRYLNELIAAAVINLNIETGLNITIMMGVIMCVDLAITTHVALNLRRLLFSMTKIKEEIEKLQLRIDVLLDSANEKVDNIKEEINYRLDSANEKVDSIKEEIGYRLDSVNEKVDSIKEEITYRLECLNDYFKTYTQKDKASEELNQISERMNILMKSREEMTRKFDFLKRSLIKNNPSASSKKFSKAFNELKSIINEYNKKKD